LSTSSSLVPYRWEQESALVTAVIKFRFPEQKISEFAKPALVADKKVKLFYHLENIE
jgi:hypothetical protein